MTEDDAFLAAIRANPADATPKLVYADWLDERGDPRGEYLRLGFEVARLTARQAELANGIDPEWLSALRPRRAPFEVPLRSGRTVYPREVRQFQTYEGLLEGLPTTELNEQIIDRTVRAERARPAAGEPYLIRPTETPIDPPAGRGYPFGRPAMLPGVGCVARFAALGPARDAGRDFSELVVIWFQVEFALPIDPGVWEQLVSINWSRHATDYDY